MPITVRIPQPLQKLTEGKAEVDADIHAALVMVRDLRPTQRRVEDLILEEGERIKEERGAKVNGRRHKN